MNKQSKKSSQHSKQHAPKRVSIVPRLRQSQPARINRKQRALLWFLLVGLLGLSMGVESGDEHTIVLQVDKVPYFYASYAIISVLAAMLLAYGLYKVARNREKK